MDEGLVRRLRDRAKTALLLGNQGLGWDLRDAANEIERLDKMAYLRIPLPWRKRKKLDSSDSD